MKTKDFRFQKDVRNVAKKERLDMGVKNKAPKFMAGETYFLSHKTGMPAKVLIEAVYMKANSVEWMYSVRSEANKCMPAYLSESVLAQRVSKHSSVVYKIPDVAERVEDGYRFCGNFERDIAMRRGEEFARNDRIESVLLHPALDGVGHRIDDQFGIWIRWDTVIADSKLGDTIRIK